MGYSESTDFPTQNALQSNYAGLGDVFVTKFDSAGSSLEFSTYLGGFECEIGEAIDIDANGNIHLTGGTWSSDFPTVNPYQVLNPRSRSVVFVTKLDSAGSQILYSTHLGSIGGDYGHDIAVDNNGFPQVTGETASYSFPVENAFQDTHRGDIDGSVAKLDTTGSSLIYSTYLGGTGAEWGYNIAVDNAGNATVVGSTISNNFPTQGAIQGARAGSSDLFITKFDHEGGVSFSSYLGGSGYDWPAAIAVDGMGNAFVAGGTTSTNFPTANSFQDELQDAGLGDAFAIKIDFATVGVVAIDEGALPAEFDLLQNYPNPFNPETKITFAISESSPVALKVFNVLGQTVATLVDETLAPGKYQVSWTGENAIGASVPSGVYVYRLEAGSFTASRKMVLIK